MNIEEQLSLFVQRVDEIRRRPLIQNEFNPGISINLDKISGLKFVLRQPNEDILRSFLLTFRQFLLNDEPINMNRIYNICDRYITSDKLRESLRHSRRKWKVEMKRGHFSLNISGENFTPEFIIDLWVNGFYFHTDERKYKRLCKLVPYEKLLTKYLFLDFMVEAIRQLIFTSNIIRHALSSGYISTNPLR